MVIAPTPLFLYRHIIPIGVIVEVENGGVFAIGLGVD
jgi:hypothetical protein